MRFGITVRGRSPHHVVVGAGPETPLGEVAERIIEVTGEPGTDLYHGTHRFDREASLADAGLYEGAVVATAPHPAPAPPPVPLLDLHVVSGPGAGTIHPLTAGRHTVGGSTDCGVYLPGTPEVAAEVTVTPDGTVYVRCRSDARLVEITPPPAAVPKKVKNEPPVPKPPEEPMAEPGEFGDAWPAEADLEIAGTLLRWVVPEPPDSSIKTTEDGVGLDFNRPPRIVEPIAERRHRIPTRPVYRGRNPFPMTMVLAPIAMGIGMVLLFHNAYFAMFAVFSPVFGLANWISGRHNGKRRFQRDLADYYVEKAAKERTIRAEVARERVLRLEVAPDPAAVLLMATGPGRRLWERRPTDPDHLVLRVGTVDQPSLVQVDDQDRSEGRMATIRWDVPSIPLGVSLPDRGVVGVAGPPERARPLAGWLLAQVAALHSPNGVRLALLTDPGTAPDWEWLRWLPHLRSPFGGGLSVGNDQETVAYRVSELLGTVARRAEASQSRYGRVLFTEPDIVVLVDGARRMRDVPGMLQLLTDGPAVHVYCLCVDREVRMLPKEATGVVVDNGETVALRQDGLPEVAGLRADLVGPEWFETLARALSPLRDATPDAANVLPSSLRLTDLLGMPDPDPAQVIAGWRARPASTKAAIGGGYDGALSIDLEADGPHALLAGTTGSGKSELLQTLVASLAVANRPDELTFLLFDYKGGSAFRTCVDLPHTLGMVTDLDGHLVNRVLESLAAELRRRERLLAEHGAKDQRDYLARRRADPALPPLPRLVLVVDEFATLVREVPEFVRGMVSLAQRGRSLGIHLVLATQRPAGVITGDIRANTNLRIALRVLDPAESKDVIDTGDAALIPPGLPGRALVRLSHGAVVAFQTAYAGAPHHRDENPPATPASVVEVPWSRLGRDDGVLAHAAEPETEQGATDLDALVEAVRAATDTLRIEPQPRPWLPPLADRLTLADLPPVGPAPGAGLAPVAIGMEDLPAEQAQRPVLVDPATFTHLYVIGTTRSGRSQALRTLAGALADRFAVAEVHLYGIDAAGGGLSVLTELPHTGAVADRNDVERLDRLIGRLNTELSERQELLSRHQSANLTELRATMPPGPRPAHLFLLVDGWESLYSAIEERDNGKSLDGFLRLVREGGAAGVHVVAAGDRGLLGGRVGSLNEHRIMLRMSDTSDFLLIGVSRQNVSPTLPPGRGWQSGGIREMQFALLASDPSGRAQADALRRIGRRAAERDAGALAASRPFTVGELPIGIGFAAAFTRLTELRPLVALLGIGPDETGPVVVDFAGRMQAFMVVGGNGSGRSTTLATLAVSLLATGTRLLLLTPRESPLRRLAGDPNVRLLSGPDLTSAAIDAALAELGTPCVVVVDDVELLVRNSAPDQALRQVVATGRDHGLGLVCAGTADAFQLATGSWIGEVRRGRQAVLLNPQSMNEGDLLGTRLPMEIVRRPLRLGRGYVVNTTVGGVVTVALPLTELRNNQDAPTPVGAA